MKKLVLTLLTGGLLMASINLKAQDKKEGAVNAFRFGIGLEGGLPIGALKNGYDIGAGLTLRFSKDIAENFDATLTTGGMAFFPKNLSNANSSSKASIFIPIKAGGRYMLSENFYAMAEAGITIAKTYTVTGFNGTTPTYGFISATSFTYAPSLGVKFGAIDLGVRYEGLDNGGFIGARLGFTF